MRNRYRLKANTSLLNGAIFATFYIIGLIIFTPILLILELGKPPRRRRRR